MKFQQQEAATKRQPVEGRSTPFPFDDLDCDDLPPEKGTVRERMHRNEFESFPDREIDRAELARALTVLLDWLIPAQTLAYRPKVLATSSGLRVIALAWSLNPAFFGEMSQEQLAKMLGVSDSILSRYGQSFANRFGVFSARQLTPRQIASRKAAREMPTPPADPSIN